MSLSRKNDEELKTVVVYSQLGWAWFCKVCGSMLHILLELVGKERENGKEEGETG